VTATIKRRHRIWPTGCPAMAVRPAGQDSEALIAAPNGHSTARFAPEKPADLGVAVAPATAPSIYFAGTPAVLSVNSRLVNYSPATGFICQGPSNFPPGGNPLYVGPAQNVPVSSLGLTLPFSIK